MWFVFFFRAEDGIRAGRVTGVQTCALPISFRPAERGGAEWDRDLGLSLFRFGLTACAAPAENRREDVAEAAEVRDVEVAAVLRGGATAACPPLAPTAAKAGARKGTVAPQLIVFLALVAVTQHVVRFVDLLEALGRLRIVGVAIGMVLLGQSPKCLLDFVRRGGFGDSQHLIVVALCRHYCPCQVSTTTRAGRSNVSRIL